MQILNTEVSSLRAEKSILTDHFGADAVNEVLLKNSHMATETGMHGHSQSMPNDTSQNLNDNSLNEDSIYSQKPPIMAASGN